MRRIVLAAVFAVAFLGTGVTDPTAASAQPAPAQPASVQPASAQPASAQPASAQPASAQPASTVKGGPSAAALENCPVGDFCIWSGVNYSGTFCHWTDSVTRYPANCDNIAVSWFNNGQFIPGVQDVRVYQFQGPSGGASVCVPWEPPNDRRPDLGSYNDGVNGTGFWSHRPSQHHWTDC
jgi:hypothetical protein